MNKHKVLGPTELNAIKVRYDSIAPAIQMYTARVLWDRVRDTTGGVYSLLSVCKDTITV